MKTKTYRTTMAMIVGILAIIFAVILVVGIILEVATEMFAIPAIAFGGILMLVMLFLFFVENGKTFTMRPNEIVLPKESRRNGREISGRMSVLFSDITSIKIDEAVFTNTVYEMNLRNGDVIRFKLKGISAEKEEKIYRTIELRIGQR